MWPKWRARALCPAIDDHIWVEPWPQNPPVTLFVTSLSFKPPSILQTEREPSPALNLHWKGARGAIGVVVGDGWGTLQTAAGLLGRGGGVLWGTVQGQLPKRSRPVLHTSTRRKSRLLFDNIRHKNEGDGPYSETKCQALSCPLRKMGWIPAKVFSFRWTVNFNLLAKLHLTIIVPRILSFQWRLARHKPVDSDNEQIVSKLKYGLYSLWSVSPWVGQENRALWFDSSMRKGGGVRWGGEGLARWWAVIWMWMNGAGTQVMSSASLSPQWRVDRAEAEVRKWRCWLLGS